MRTPPYQLGIRSWLLGLVAFAIIPFFAFSGYLIYVFGKTQQTTVQTALMERTVSTANAMGQLLDNAMSKLTVLTNSDAALENDLGKLYQHALRVVESSGEISAISLVDANERVIFVTLQPYGTTQLSASDPLSVREVFETGAPNLSNVFKSPLSDRYVTALNMPLYQNGKVVYCLRAIIRTDTINELLDKQSLPDDWFSRVVDANGRYIARSVDQDLYVGTMVRQRLWQAIRNAETHIFESETKEGIPTETYIRQLSPWNWTVAMSVPKRILNEPIRDALKLMAVWALLMIILTVLLATWLANVTSRHLENVLSLSIALHHGDSLEIEQPPIRELGQIVEKLQDISHRDKEARNALANLSELHETATTKLESARRDTLTGLAGREMFLDLSDQLHQQLQLQDDAMLAVLFIDLDGFKKINDTYGHEQGDVVLKKSAEVLIAMTRGSDVVGRLGGDEFVVCISGAKDHIRNIATDVVSRILNEIPKIGLDLGCSIGIAIWTGSCSDIGCVIRQADEAMYSAKHSGKNRYVMFGDA